MSPPVPAAATVPRVTDMRKLLLVACLAFTVGLALLASAVFHADGVRHLDARMLAHLSADHFGRLGDLAGLVADLGSLLPQVLLLVVGVAMALHGRRREAALAGLAIVLGADLTTAVLKHALAAPRFDSVLGWTQVGEASFPSGHATAAFAMAAAWALFAPPRWRLAVACGGFLLACLVALGVVVLRYHFPSDALGGFLVAAAWTCGVLAFRMDLCPAPVIELSAGVEPPEELEL
jgi:membrane-associated phospholipid phosphatase